MMVWQIVHSFRLLIEVTDDADAPVINGQNPVAIAEDGSREITLADLVCVDPDTDPAQLIVLVQDGTNYTLEGNTVIPLPNFFGTLTVPVRINDGEANSNLFQMQVTVNAVNDAPNFNQPGNVTINEDAAQQSLTITGISAGPLESQVLSLIRYFRQYRIDSTSYHDTYLQWDSANSNNNI